MPRANIGPMAEFVAIGLALAVVGVVAGWAGWMMWEELRRR